MTATINENETDFFTIVGFELAIPCESGVECGNEAQWALKKLCCNYVALICDDCRVELEKWFDEALEEGGYYCKICEAEDFDYVWSSLS